MYADLPRRNNTGKTPPKHDDYMTPRVAWENIQHLIPKDKVIWEAFYGDGESGRILTDLGFDVIHEPIDFFENDKGDIVVSNPPFSRKKEVLTRLKELNKPFILIMPSFTIHTQYVRTLFGNQDLQIIIPRKRIHFKKLVNGLPVPNWKSDCSFESLYYCWKMNLPNDITFLD